MAVRDDITIRWDLSPRLIIIDASSSELSMQDTIDTLRTLEALPSGIDEPTLLASSGKESLGAGVTVGLTVELQNAQVYFEQRSWIVTTATIDASDSTGTYVYSDGAFSDSIEAAALLRRLTIKSTSNPCRSQPMPRVTGNSLTFSRCPGSARG